MWMGRVFVAGAMLVLAGSLAHANDCEPVAAAYDALGKAPAYRQTVKMSGSELLEIIAVGDTLYTKEPKGWKKIQMKPGARAAMQKRVVPGADALKDCRRVGTEAVGGKDAVVYDYTPPPVKGAGDLGPQRVWISVETGLPLRMTSEQQKTDVSLSFDNVVAPTP